MYHQASLEKDPFFESHSNLHDWWSTEQSSDSYSPPSNYQQDKKPLREKNSSRRHSVYKHVPHKEKPPQVVAKRNARERRRVQAVNSAFVRLRNAVPIQNSRGKRISKVKTLLCAMEYISTLNKILEDYGSYPNSYEMSTQQDKNMNMDLYDRWDFEKVNTNSTKYFN